MKTTEHKAEFLIELDRIIGKMYDTYKKADDDSILLLWLQHNRDRKPYHPRAIPRMLPNLARYGKYKSKCIPRILGHVEWVYVKDISYTNFILGFIRPKAFSIEVGHPISGHTLHDIYVPLELSLMHSSTNFLYADWLA